MTDRPILFSAPMVRALLAGTKTQTRRVVKPQPPDECGIHYMLGNESWLPEEKREPLRHHWEAWGGPLYANRPKGHLCGSHSVNSPYGKPGDRLWVRETWARNWNQLSDTRMDRGYVYRADGEARAQDNGTDLPWKPSIHMPRWASRITLEVTAVRVEKLQDISQADAIAEGGPPSHRSIDRVSRELGYADFSRSWYAQLWDSINGAGSWEANPWVWVVEFSLVTP